MDRKTTFTPAQLSAMLSNYRLAQQRFTQGTPARRHKHVHDRADDGPNSRTSLHMLRRSVNLGYTWVPPEQP
jgi:hypothetical protein